VGAYLDRNKVPLERDRNLFIRLKQEKEIKFRRTEEGEMIKKRKLVGLIQDLKKGGSLENADGHENTNKWETQEGHQKGKKGGA